MEPILLEIPTELVTPRLHLRVARPGDGALILPAIRESLAQLKPWMPWAKDEYGESDAELWVRRAAAAFLKREIIDMLILSREEGRHLGSVGFHSFKWNVPRCEIGYMLRTSETGNGYMAEAIGAMLGLAEKLKMRRVESRPDALNARSRRVTERAGFQLEGILRDSVRMPSGELGSPCVYARLFNPAD
jgi:RimJ/RimL family protein N-acetyltransferase